MSSRKEESLAEIISEDFLQCGICLEDFKSPKTLACLHTFCQDCLKAFHAKCSDQTVAICPTCRDETPLKDCNIQSLKDNFVLSNLQNVVSWMASDVPGKPSVCDNCEADGQRETAVVRCNDCDENLCGQCYKAHSRMKLTKNHKVDHLSGQDMTTEKKVIAPTVGRAGGQLDSTTFDRFQEFKCESHSESVKLFCIKCEVPICLICYATEHTNHNCLNWKDAVEQECQKIRGILTELAKNTEDAQSSLQAVSQDMQQLETKMNDVVTDIGNKRVAFYSLVDHYANSQINKVRETLKGEIKQLDMKRNEITDSIEISQHELQMAEHVLREGSDGEKVALKKKLREKMQVLEDIKGGVEVGQQSARIQFQPGILTEGTIESLFGRVYISKPKPPQSQNNEPIDTLTTVAANVVETRQHMASMSTPVRIEPPTPPPKKPAGKSPLVVIETRTPSDNNACNITGLALLQNDNFVIADSANGAVKLFAHEGYILKEMRKSYDMLSPYSIAIAQDDKILVTDGGYIKATIASAMRSNVILDCKVQALGGIALHPVTGNVYVTDRQRSNIYVCDVRERKIVRALTEAGHLKSRGCTYLAINSNNQLVVSFPVSGVVQVFNLLPQVSLLGTYGPAGFRPGGLCIDGENNVIVTDMNANRVIVLSPTVQVKRSVLLSQEDGIESPQVVALDKQGRLLVGEERSGKVKIFPYEKP